MHGREITLSPVFAAYDYSEILQEIKKFKKKEKTKQKRKKMNELILIKEILTPPSI